MNQDNLSDDIMISQGAEGKLYLSSFMGKKCIIKERFVKKYRLPELDKTLTKNRMLNESRNIARCSKAGINVPTIYFVDMLNRKIYMQCISNSVQLKEVLRVIDDYTVANKGSKEYDELIEKICIELGEMLAKLHGSDIIHGDLTPSNILIKINDIKEDYDFNSGKNKILSSKTFDYMYLIDFGLSSVSNSFQGGIEDKAVDLYVLKRAIVSSNPKSEEIFEKVLDIYQQKCPNGDKIVEHYKKVEMRGRKKLAFG